MPLRSSKRWICWSLPSAQTFSGTTWQGVLRIALGECPVQDNEHSGRSRGCRGFMAAYRNGLKLGGFCRVHNWEEFTWDYNGIKGIAIKKVPIIFATQFWSLFIYESRSIEPPHPPATPMHFLVALVNPRSLHSPLEAWFVKETRLCGSVVQCLIVSLLNPYWNQCLTGQVKAFIFQPL